MNLKLTAQMITRITMSGIVLLISSSTLFSQPDTWVQKADFGGTATYGAIGFSIGSKGYVGTGHDGGSYKKDFWEYDPSTNTWSQKADFGGTVRFAAVGFSIGAKGYIGTGSDFGGLTKDFWEYDPSTNTWSQKADFGGTARYVAVGFSIGAKGYIGTGSDAFGFKKDFWEYDPSTNTWSQKADFGGTERNGAVGFSIGTKGYIGTGIDNSDFKKDFWEYDPSTNTWLQKADFGGTARANAVGVFIGSKGYIGTGGDGFGLTKDFWEYDPSNTWVQKADFGGTARNVAVGFSIGSKGYIGTGNDGIPKKDFWEYTPCVTNTTFYRDADNDTYGDPNNTTQECSAPPGYVGNSTDCNDANNAVHPGAAEICNGVDDDCDGSVDEGVQNTSETWMQKADFGGIARHDAIGFSVGNKGYIGTGYDGNMDGSGFTKDFWEYDPATNIWSQKADFGGTARTRAAGFSIGGKGYIGTGLDGSGYKKDFWEYDPATNTWLQKADFGGIARHQAVGFSIGSKGYIGTGYDGGSGGIRKKDFWEYDPAINTWLQKADFGGTARVAAIGFSIGAKGYIGTGTDGINKKDFWEYDPATNTWLQKADFGGTARYFAVGFPIGVKGYIGTGFDGGSYKKDFWEYDPSTNTWLQKTDFGGTVRVSAVGFPIGSKGYIGTGADGPKKDFWEYTPGVTSPTFYRDLDNDGYGDPNNTTESCNAPPGYVSDNTDCDDTKAAVHPGATEVCNGIDDDCDGQIDEGVKSTFYRDTDKDTYGDPNNTTQACSAPPDYVSDNTDCNDNDATVHPGATEVCNGIDDDCDGQIDESVKSTFYRDADNDTYGDPNNTTQACSAPPGYVSDNTDCNDNDATIHPGATEVCNGIDDDCDGSVDEGVQNTFYQDADGDGYGNAAVSILACTAPAGYVNNSTDCNDANNAIHPGATEICNGVDDDCDGSVDEATEVCNGIDDDCDGQIDEGCPSLPTISIEDKTVYESEGVAIVRINLSKLSAVNIRVTYSTIDGTATSKGRNKDYATTKGNLTIPSGSQTATISIAITNDGIAEPQEYFAIQLSKPVNASISDGTGTVTIIDGTTPGSKVNNSGNSIEEETSAKKLTVKALPNPSVNTFKLIIQGNAGMLNVKVIDIYGRMIETRSNIIGNGILEIGHNYRPGIYFVEVTQGIERRQIKLIKLSD